MPRFVRDFVSRAYRPKAGFANSYLNPLVGLPDAMATTSGGSGLANRPFESPRADGCLAPVNGYWGGRLRRGDRRGARAGAVASNALTPFPPLLLAGGIAGIARFPFLGFEREIAGSFLGIGRLALLRPLLSAISVKRLPRPLSPRIIRRCTMFL